MRKCRRCTGANPCAAPVRVRERQEAVTGPQGHNGYFQGLKGVHVGGDKTQRGLCFRPGMGDGNEGNSWWGGGRRVPDSKCVSEGFLVAGVSQLSLANLSQ